MDKELIKHTKRGHRVYYRNEMYHVIEDPKDGLVRAVKDIDYEQWHHIATSIMYKIAVPKAHRMFYEEAPKNIDLRDAEPAEKIRFMYKGQQIQITTGDQLVINGDPCRFFFIDSSHLSYEVTEDFEYVYHVSEFVSLIEECKTEIEYPKTAA